MDSTFAQRLMRPWSRLVLAPCQSIINWLFAARTRSRSPPPVAESLMLGACASTYRLGQPVVKVPRIDTEDAPLTLYNAEAPAVEANAYRIIGVHDRIARCHYMSPHNDLVALEFYCNGNLRDFAAAHSLKDLRKWAKQMIQGVHLIHSKCIRHSDIRLDQWLVDSGCNARLSDFNSAGYDGHLGLSIAASKALGLEEVSHFMPRDPDGDNTVLTDLFASGSALFELERGCRPYAGLDDETITKRFEPQHFPTVSDMELGRIIAGCWHGRYTSAEELLREAVRDCGL